VHVLTVRHSARQSLAGEHSVDPDDEANPVH
jgi:hypothetical protein